MDKTEKIYIAGHRGMVGSAIFRKLNKEGYHNIVYRTSAELDLTDQTCVKRFFAEEKPVYVFLCAAKVGGIVANNTYRAQFIYENLMIQNNVIHQSFKSDVKKLIFMGSSCIYPKLAEQPILEESLLTGFLEETNEPYAIAKIAGLKMCENYHRQYGCNFFSIMPCNLYGPFDNFHLTKSHVLSALLRKMHLGTRLENNDWTAIRKDLNRNPIANTDGNSNQDIILTTLANIGIKSGPNPSVEVWGSGNVFREFLFVDDLADAAYFLFKNYNLAPTLVQNRNNDYFFNVGSGHEITINELALIVKKITGFRGELHNDLSKPDGTPRKLLDVNKMTSYGWRYSTSINEGIKIMYDWYLNNQ